MKFANKYVRVIDASVAVGDATLFHTHSLDNVPVAISGGKLKTELQGREDATFSTVATGAVSFAKAAYTHRITNVGDTPLRFIDAEILAPSGKSSMSDTPDQWPGYKLEIDNEKVRIYRLTLEPGASTERHTHKLPGLMVVIHRGRVAIEYDGRRSKTEKFEAGAFRWFEAGTNHSLKNAGDTRIEIVNIEWK